MTSFWLTMLLLTLKRQDFIDIFCEKLCNMVWSSSGFGTGTETFPKSEPEPQKMTVPQYCQYVCVMA
jgi:hypothetical protein